MKFPVLGALAALLATLLAIDTAVAVMAASSGSVSAQPSHVPYADEADFQRPRLRCQFLPRGDIGDIDKARSCIPRKASEADALPDTIQAE